MDDSSHSTYSTPKRKRTDAADEVPSQLNIHFSFEVPQGLLSDGGDSPRTKVAHRFRGLVLADSGGGAAAADARVHDTESHPGRDTTDGDSDKMVVDEDESKMRKRSKLTPPTVSSDGSPQPKHQPLPPTQPQHQLSVKRVEVPETPAAHRTEPLPATGTESPSAPGGGHVLFEPSASFPQHTAESAALTAGSSKVSSNKPPKQSSVVNNRPLENLRSKGRRRAGTPPLVASASKLRDTDQPGDTAAEVVDPIRAALTWHEDEITVYDPDDEDDDGVGINGIGFKPTPAIAYARTMKRKQQLAEYKKREEREARARRSSRRRGSPDRAIKMQRKDSVGAENARKVHFTDGESAAMISI